MAVLAAFAIFLFLWTYNDYLIAIITPTPLKGWGLSASQVVLAPAVR